MRSIKLHILSLLPYVMMFSRLRRRASRFPKKFRSSDTVGHLSLVRPRRICNIIAKSQKTRTYFLKISNESPTYTAVLGSVAYVCFPAWIRSPGTSERTKPFRQEGLRSNTLGSVGQVTCRERFICPSEATPTYVIGS